MNSLTTSPTASASSATPTACASSATLWTTARPRLAKSSRRLVAPRPMSANTSACCSMPALSAAAPKAPPPTTASLTPASPNSATSSAAASAIASSPTRPLSPALTRRRSTNVRIQQFVAESLGDASYLLVSANEAAVIDPQRDITPFVKAANAHGATIRYVVETHVHNDYVSGGRELAALGA